MATKHMGMRVITHGLLIDLFQQIGFRRSKSGRIGFCQWVYQVHLQISVILPNQPNVKSGATR